MDPVAGDLIILRTIQPDAVIVVCQSVIPNIAVLPTEMNTCIPLACTSCDCESRNIHVKRPNIEYIAFDVVRMHCRHRRAVIGADCQAFADIDVLDIRAVTYDDGVTLGYTIIIDGMLNSPPRVNGTSIARIIATSRSYIIKISRARHGNQGDEERSKNDERNYPHPGSVQAHLSDDFPLL